MEYKTNPAEKERLKPTANLKAIDIEKALKEKTSGESEYRMEARNLTTFLMVYWGFWKRINGFCR